MIQDFANLIVRPSNIISLLIFISLLLAILKLYKPLYIAVSLTTAIYFIIGSGPVSHFMLSSLEYQYAPYIENTDTASIDTIVILTGDAEIKPLIPFSSYMNASSTYRSIEALRIFQLDPNRNIIISGFGSVPDIIKQVLIKMSVPANKITLDSASANTYESAVNLKAILDKKYFLLVTSAGHMPRAMSVFKSQDLDPVPAPTQHLSQKNILAAQYLPSVHHLMYVDLAAHEYIATLWYIFTKKIDLP